MLCFVAYLPQFIPRFIPAQATTANATTATVIIPNIAIIFFLSFNLLISLFEIFQKSSSESQNQVPNRPQTCLESIS